MVVWLASDESLLVSGQVFRAVGADITHYHGWSLGRDGLQPGQGGAPEVGPGPPGSALARDVFGLRPGGLNMPGKA